MNLIDRINNFINKQNKRYHFDYETNSPKNRSRGTVQGFGWEDAPNWETAKYTHSLKQNLGEKEYPKKYKLTSVEE